MGRLVADGWLREVPRVGPGSRCRQPRPALVVRSRCSASESRLRLAQPWHPLAVSAGAGGVRARRVGGAHRLELNRMRERRSSDRPAGHPWATQSPGGPQHLPDLVLQHPHCCAADRRRGRARPARPPTGSPDSSTATPCPPPTARSVRRARRRHRRARRSRRRPGCATAANPAGVHHGDAVGADRRAARLHRWPAVAPQAPLHCFHRRRWWTARARAPQCSTGGSRGPCRPLDRR